MFSNKPEILLEKIKKLEADNLRMRTILASEFNNGRSAQREEGIVIIDSDFNVIEVNEKRFPNVDLNGSKVLGGKCYSVLYGSSTPCDECTVSEVLKTSKISRFVQPYSNKDAIKFEEKIVFPIIDVNGKTERILICSKDISIYSHLAGKDEIRETFYQNLFESAADAFMVHDEDGNLIEFSSKLSILLGYSHEEMKQLKVLDFDDPSSSMEFNQRINELKKNGIAVFETNLICKSGKLVPVEVSANSLHFERKQVFFVAIRNVEKRKLAEQKLKESEERFRTLVENVPDLIMRFDKSHRHLFVNSASKTILKIDSEKFIGKTHREMGFPEKMCSFWELEMNHTFVTKRPHLVEFMLEIEGDVHYFEWKLIPESNLDENRDTLLAIARDVTIRKKAEQALNEAIKTKDKFFSIIAHDLKNPFNALLPISKNLEQNCTGMTADQVKEAAGLIYSAANQEYNLLGNLLEWSRSQMGQITRNPKYIDLLALVESSVLLHSVKASKKDIFVSVKSEAENKAFADEYMIDAVIRNLYSNALKFTYPKGEITIMIKNNGSKILVSIEDNGIGISSENIEKLFRIDTSYVRVGTNEETGTGLGLILCKEFIEQNLGEIFVESKIGQGSIFSFTLPCN